MKRIYRNPEITNKKLIIVEGLDRVGKDTLISNIQNDFTIANKPVKTIHFTGPSKEEVIKIYKEYTSENAFNYQKDIFNNAFDETIYCVNQKKISVIWNRSHIGEYVYGQLFRGLTSSGIQKEINDMNFYLFDHLNKLDAILITMICSDIEFLLKNEDGNSLSIESEDKQNEVNLFKHIHDNFPLPDKNKFLIDIADEKYMNKSENVYFDVLRRFS